MEMSLTLMQIESGKCPCCGERWENDRCVCCGASVKEDDERITLFIPHEGIVILKGRKTN